MTLLSDDGFGHWLAGFADGEGCFNIARNGNGSMFCQFRIQVRSDDEPILLEIQRRTGLGRLTKVYKNRGANPSVIWYVSSKAECLALVELFETYPLRAKKQRDFEIWARAVRSWQTLRQRGPCYSGPRPIDLTLLPALKEELHAIRKIPEYR
jgi:hypothetical protein